MDDRTPRARETDEPRSALPRPSLARLAEDVLPALIARLDVSELGELEVRHDGWRVRLRRSITAGDQVAAPAHGSAEPAHAVPLSHDSSLRVATSPAVGYYTPNDRAVVGREVAAGDVLGWVDVLGVRQEVVAPASGVIGRLLAEPGQAVEYGQELLVIDLPRRGGDEAAPGDDAADAATPDGTGADAAPVAG